MTIGDILNWKYGSFSCKYDDGAEDLSFDNRDSTSLTPLA